MLVYLKFLAFAVLIHVVGRLDKINDRHVTISKFLSRLVYFSDSNYSCRPIDLFLTLFSNLFFIIVIITMIVTRFNTGYAEKYFPPLICLLYILSAALALIEEGLNGSHNCVSRILFFLFGIQFFVLAILILWVLFFRK